MIARIILPFNSFAQFRLPVLIFLPPSFCLIQIWLRFSSLGFMRGFGSLARGAAQLSAR
jgi:hypothetical protein